MRTRRRILVMVTAAALAVFGWVIPAYAGAEESFVAKINAERSAQGLAQVQSYWDLVDDARAQSQRMAESGDLHHNPNLASVTSSWQALGENVGVGASVESLHEAFMASSAHRGNILGDYNYVGVGVVQDAEGTLWVTAVFMKGPAGLVGGGEATTTPTVAPTTTTTVAPTPTTTVAAQTTTTIAEPPPADAVAAEEAPPSSSNENQDVSVATQGELVPLGRPGLVHLIME